MADRTIDTLIQLDRARLSRLADFIARGVKIIDPLSTHIAENVAIGEGTVIYPMTIIESEVSIGKNCSIGPFARVRKNVTIADSVEIGNFVEVVRSVITNNSKVKHLTYIGDAVVGENVNIGAGTVIANYDGKKKHRTFIKNGAFIGSGTILIAPVEVGKEAMTAAGAVVTRNKNIPDGCVVAGVPARALHDNGQQCVKTKQRKAEGV